MRTSSDKHTDSKSSIRLNWNLLETSGNGCGYKSELTALHFNMQLLMHSSYNKSYPQTQCRTIAIKASLVPNQVVNQMNAFIKHELLNH